MHIEFTQLWMPILVAAVACFVASALIWMALPFLHKNDYRKLPNEGAMMDAVRSQSLGGGVYMFPACDPKTLKSDPAAMERYNNGPWGVLVVVAKKWSMGTCLPLWMGYLVLVNIFIAYIASVALPAGSAYLKVFQLTGAVAFMPYALACIPMSIWEGKPWGNTIRHMVDGVIYTFLTAGIYGWLWPKAALAAPGVPGIGG